MSSQRSGLRITAALLCLLPFLFGCGAATTAVLPVATPASPAFLTGNWLLTGMLPLNPLPSGAVNPNFGAATTITVVGNDVLADVHVSVPCSVIVPGFIHLILEGSVTSDGSISVSTGSQVVLLPTASITGKLPATAAATSWVGHLIFSGSSGFPCSPAQDVDFTATRIADVTGSYVGTTSVNVGGTSQAITLSFVLQQATTAPGGQLTNAFLLTGSLNLQGSNCLSNGTLPGIPTSPPQGVVPVSSVSGSEVRMMATMNDGSTASMIGEIMDAASSNISIGQVIGSGGACGAYSAGPLTLIKQ